MDYIKKYIHWPLRLYLAYVFIPIGFDKLGVKVNDMETVGYLVGPFELYGPILILIGAFVITERSSGVVIVNKSIGDILTRIGAAMIAIIMVGAIYLHVFTWSHGFDKVYFPLLLLVFSLIFLVRGNKFFE
tara:strand:- start:103 stop:495 length:393 start_codon:yes stop_codon:yes gene_type:complete